jgi:hypothetical protein
MKIESTEHFHEQIRAHQQQIANLLYHAWCNKEMPAIIDSFVSTIPGLQEALKGYQELEQMAYIWEE